VTNDNHRLAAIERLRSLPNTGERLHAIISRCDLQGELHRSVAQDLGISRRQFYRDLSAARAIVKQTSVEIASGPRMTATESRVHTALSLSATGHGQAAILHLSPFVASLRGDEAVWGNAVLAELSLEAGDLKSAEIVLRVAESFCIDPCGPHAAYALHVWAKILHAKGVANEAHKTLEHAVAMLERCTPTQLARDTLSDARSLLAFCHHERGNFAEAAAIDARNAASLPSLSPLGKRQYLNVHAILACDSPHGPELGREASHAYHAYAVQHGLLDDVSNALLQMGGIARFENRLEEAEGHLQDALNLKHAIGQPTATTLSMMTGTAIEAGKVQLATALAKNTRATSPEGSYAWGASHLHEAEALIASGRHLEAQTACDTAREFNNGRNTRLASWNRRVSALIHKRSGETRKALHEAEESLEILGEHGPPFHRLKGLLAAEIIKPSNNRASKIRELKSVLRWP